MGSKSSGLVIGYRYMMGMHMVVSLGVDVLLGIAVDQRILWGFDPVYGFQLNGITSTQDLDIQQDGLFGGDQREGGISGTLGVLFGDPGQVQDPYLQSMFGPYTPAFRGVFSVVLKQMYIGLNPYLKPWAFLVRRMPGRDWIPQGLSVVDSIAGGYHAAIQAPDGHFDANPIHIIRECLTDASFGMGYPTNLIDDASFSQAAITCHDEGFGVSIIWNKQAAIENFIALILNHINGVLVVGANGLFKIKLLRPDYDTRFIPSFDESNIVEIVSFQRLAWAETINEVVVQYTDRFTAQTLTVTVQDIANMSIQQGVSSMTKQYLGIANADLAYRVAQRDLQTLSTPLAKVNFKVNRAAWSLNIGDVFNFSWVKLGIAETVFRIGQIDFGTDLESIITISAVEDVFGLPAVSYASGSNIAYNAAPNYPVPIIGSDMIMTESSYWDAVTTVGTAQLNTLLGAGKLTETSTFVMVMARRAYQSTHSYWFETFTGFNTTPDGGWAGYYSPTCLLPNLPQEITSTVIYSGETDWSLVAPGDYGYLMPVNGAQDNQWYLQEMAMVKSVDTTTKTVVLARGILDTIPKVLVNPRFFVTSKLNGFARFEYAAGESLNGLLLANFPWGQVPASAQIKTPVTTVGRMMLPYPPGNFQINGLRYPTASAITTGVAVTWAHRNKEQQTAYIVEQWETNVTPPTGLKYTVQLTSSLIGGITTLDPTHGSPIANLNLSGNAFTFTSVDIVDSINAFITLMTTYDPSSPTLATVLANIAANGSTLGALFGTQLTVLVEVVAIGSSTTLPFYISQKQTCTFTVTP